MIELLVNSLVNGDIHTFRDLVEKVIRANPPNVVMEILNKAADEVGEKFENGQLFISDLIFTGFALKESLAMLKPRIKKEESERGRIVLGTIEGDIHDIGKDIVSILLTAAGFEVYDLGIDVSPRRFVEKAKEVDADVIGISALLSTTVVNTARIVAELESEGMKGKVKIILGGAIVLKDHVKVYGVDAAVNDAIEGVNIIKEWVPVGG